MPALRGPGFRYSSMSIEEPLTQPNGIVPPPAQPGYTLAKHWQVLRQVSVTGARGDIFRVGNDRYRLGSGH